jgi:hypothetical protein
MSGVETAAANPAAGRGSPFPSAWATPPADPVERAAWIAVNTRSRPLLPHQETRGGAHRTTPQAARLRLLELTKDAP